MTKELTDQLISLLTGAGIHARAAHPASQAPRLSAPETTVSLATAAVVPAGLGQYLGAADDAPTGPRAIYGRRLEAAFRLRVASPVSLGGAACEAEADRVMDALLAGADGMTILEFSAEPYAYDHKTDCFLRAVTVKAAAQLYTLGGTEAEETVGDFTLEGNVH